MPIIKIKATHEPTQGPFVVIEAADFDPAKGHVRYGEPSAPAGPAPTAAPTHAAQRGAKAPAKAKN